MESLWFPYVSAVARNPAAETLYIWYKGEKVCEIKRQTNSSWSLAPYNIKKSADPPPPSPYTPDYYYYQPRQETIVSLRLSSLTKDANPLPTDFTMGAEGDARPLDYQLDLSPEQITEADRIFQEVFGGNWKSLGQWIYKKKFPGIPEHTRYTTRTVRSKTLRIAYEVPKKTEVDSETGSEYTAEDEDAPNFEDKHVFLADGMLYNIKDYRSKPFDPPTDLKLSNVKMMQIPLTAWLLILRPTEFVDTATVCMAFKKMIHDQAKTNEKYKYLVRYLWIMENNEMVPITINNTRVWKENRELSMDEIRTLMDRKNDFWMGKHWKIVKLFT